MIKFPKKSLGQNFLHDEKVLSLIADLGQIKKDDIVFEIGPGTGNLTEKIIKKKPREIILIEKDKSLFNLLKKKYTSRTRIINEDILKYSHQNFIDKEIIIFGNLPYNISTQILINWIKIDNLKKFCKRLILMFQKEVADRIIAKSNTKKFGRLSIMSSWKLDIKKIIDINPSSFYPKPKVKSSLLLFEPKNIYHKLKDPSNLEHVTNIFFNQRRKMIKKPFKILFKNYEKIAKNLSLDLNLRPHNLSNSTYYNICSEYEKLL